MTFEEDSAPLCPWCRCFVEVGQPTVRYNKILWHAGCYEDMERAEAKESQAIWDEASG